MTLVVDASVLITLAKIGRLNLLPDLSESVYIPDAVFDEVVRRGVGRSGGAEIAQASWISHRQVRDQAAVARLQVGWGTERQKPLYWRENWEQTS